METQSPAPIYKAFQKGTYIDSRNQIGQQGYHAANTADVMVYRGINQMFLQRIATTDLIAFNLRGKSPPKILFEAPDSFLRGSSIVDGKVLDDLEGIVVDEVRLKRVAEGFQNPQDVIQDPLWNALSRADQTRYGNVLELHAKFAYSLKKGASLMAIKLQAPRGRFIEIIEPSMGPNDYLILPLMIESLPQSDITVQGPLPEYSQEDPLIGIKEQSAVLFERFK